MQCKSQEPSTRHSLSSVLMLTYTTFVSISQHIHTHCIQPSNPLPVLQTHVFVSEKSCHVYYHILHKMFSSLNLTTALTISYIPSHSANSCRSVKYITSIINGKFIKTNIMYTNYHHHICIHNLSPLQEA